MYKSLKACSLMTVAVLVTACEVKKSSNPLSPSVAGPIPGVNITGPKSLEPVAGSRIEFARQPITLSVENATTNGVRPLTYLFEVAADAQFATKVFSQAGIQPGNGKTSVVLPEFPTGRTYFWRALAQDGANTGTYTPTLAFSVFTPVVIQAPTLLSPAAGELLPTLVPPLVVGNAPRSGPIGAIYYQITVVEANGAFPDGGFYVPEGGGAQTTVAVPPGVLAFGKQYSWRARAYDSATVGPWSAVQSFQTPAAPTLPGPVGGGGSSPGGGAGSADFDGLGNVQIVGGSPDVRSWAVTSRITSLRFSPGNIHLEHTKTGQWPGVDIGGALQEMTLWVFFNIGGQWYATGGERWRPAQTDKALSAPSAIGPGWFYNNNWAPMTGYVPRPGEQVGFMVVAGSTRVDSNAPVKERSNILMIPFPADGVTASFP